MGEWVSPGERYAKAQGLLTEFAGSPALRKPLSTWVSPHDRHLAQSLLPLPLTELLTYSLDDLLAMRGVGSRRIEKLLDLLDRVSGQLARERNRPHDEASPRDREVPEADPSEPLDPNAVTDEQWSRWCATIRGHRLEDEPLGRYASRLVDLSSGLWPLPLREYTARPLQEVRELPTHGPARLAQIFRVIAGLARALGGPPRAGGLLLCPYPPGVRDAARWAEASLRGGAPPSAADIRERLLSPLLRQLEEDMGPDAQSMLRRRLGLDGRVETLEAIAADVGLTKERIRQLTGRAIDVLAVRWPEGKFLLDDFYELLQAAPDAQEAVECLRGILDACFDVRYSRAHSRGEVLAAWEREGRAKRTPMTEDELRGWLAAGFPHLSPEVARGWLTASGHREERAGGRYFSSDPADLLLRHLHTTGEAVHLSDALDFLEGDERNVANRLERDPRYIEDEYHRYLPAESCGFFRRAGVWHARLEPAPGRVDPPRTTALAVGELIQLLIGGLVQAGVCDATVWGVHRHAGAALRSVHGAALPPAVTPFVLASMLVRHSDGLVRSMRRRRLRWDVADGSIPVRGKRGWVDAVVNRAGVPLTYDELDRALRASYQDYESYVLKQLDSDDEEDGERTYRYRFVPGASVHVPAIILPGDWELDAACQNVSEEVRQLATRIVSASARAPYPKYYLRRHPWLVRLCEQMAYGNMRWAEGPVEAEPDDVPVEDTDPGAAEPRGDEPPGAPDKRVDDLLSGFF